MTKTLGVIPARMASSRFPGKPLKKILDKDINVTATCVRVPVITSHSESINIEFEITINVITNIKVRIFFIILPSSFWNLDFDSSVVYSQLLGLY